MGASRPPLNTAPQQGESSSDHHHDDLNVADRLIRQLADASAGAVRTDGDGAVDASPSPPQSAPQHEILDGKAYAPSSYQHSGGGGDGNAGASVGAPQPSMEEALRIQARLAEENTRRMEDALDGHGLRMDRGGDGAGGGGDVLGEPNADCVRSIFRCLEGASAGLMAAVLEATAGGGNSSVSVGGADGYEPVVVSVVAPSVAAGGSYQNVAVPDYGSHVGRGGTGGGHRHKGKGKGRLHHSARGRDDGAGGYSTSQLSSERDDLLQEE